MTPRFRYERDRSKGFQLRHKVFADGEYIGDVVRYDGSDVWAVERDCMGYGIGSESRAKAARYLYNVRDRQLTGEPFESPE